MKPQGLGRAFFLGLISLSISSVSVAAQRNLESYPATEDTLAPGIMSPTPVEVTSLVQISTRIQASPIVAQSLKKAPVQKPQTGATAVVPSEFDAVPASQAGPVVSRLNVVAELIRKYGRAYDYRDHTLKELKGILAQLDQKAARDIRPVVPAAAPVPAPVTVRIPAMPVIHPRLQPQQPPAQTAKSDGDVDLKSLPTPVELDSNPEGSENI